MKKISAFVIFGFFICSNSFAVDMSGTLPFCKGKDYTKWTECAHVLNFTDGSKYLGNFLNGKMHGRGQFTFKNGTKYTGEFKEGKITGKGTIIWPSGKKYVGELKNGKPHGQGTFTFKDGKVLTSKFENGKAVKTNQNNSNNKFSGDPITIPLNIHIIKVKVKDFETITTKEFVEKEIDKINDIWKQANISFQIKKIYNSKANTTGFKKKWSWIKKNMPYTYDESRKHEIAVQNNDKVAKDKDTEVLLTNLNLIDYDKNYKTGAINIFYMPKMPYDVTCGVSYNLSKFEKKFKHDFIIMSHSCKGDQYGFIPETANVLAHELGHALGLKHTDVNGDLMASGNMIGKLISNETSTLARKYFQDNLN